LVIGYSSAYAFFRFVFSLPFVFFRSVSSTKLLYRTVTLFSGEVCPKTVDWCLEVVLISLDRGRFVVVHPCSTLFLRR